MGNYPQHQKSAQSFKRINAKAPYNFVSLNSEVVIAQDLPLFNKFDNQRLSGIIELEITTLTPLYIRRESNSEKFFEIDDKPKIPGSSIRGMIRNLVEIITFGKFKFFDNTRLYYRSIADPNLRDTYREQFFNKDNRTLKVKSGILRKEGDVYKIYPSEVHNGSQFYRIDFYKIKDLNVKEFSFKKVYFKPEKIVKEISEHNPNRKDFVEGYVVRSGYIQRKKREWIINKPTNNGIVISDNVIEDYKNDRTRNANTDVLEKLKHKEYSDGVPVFYLEENNKIKAFGHTAFFRIPYKLTIGEHIPKNLQNSEITDFAEAIFGCEEKWASRVFFEDGELVEGQKDIYLQTTSPKILSSPKPTTFQHYLVQDGNRLNNWDTHNVLIRGYKMYWHRKTPNSPNEANGIYSWNEGKIINDNVHTKITPVKSGIKFRAYIRFDNLTNEELGALLQAIDLPPNCCHKIGMGKPLGLGSIKINPKLYLINREERYKILFDNDYWHESKKQEDMKKFKDIFESFMMKHLSVKDKANAGSFWDIPRLKILKYILDWTNTNKPNWLATTRYMEIEANPNAPDCLCTEDDKVKARQKNKGCNEFKTRPVLLTPDKY